MTLPHGFSLSHVALEDGLTTENESEEEEFDEFSLVALTGNEIQMDMDLSQEPRCRSTLMIVSPVAEKIWVLCEMPDLDWVHVTYNGHLGKDANGNVWTWNEEGADLVESE